VEGDLSPRPASSSPPSAAPADVGRLVTGAEGTTTPSSLPAPSGTPTAVETRSREGSPRGSRRSRHRRLTRPRRPLRRLGRVAGRSLRPLSR
jgi:hypothetical protein